MSKKKDNPQPIKNIVEQAGRDGRRHRVQTQFTGPSMADGSMKAECDVNLIMAKAKRGIAPTHVKQRPAFFADVSEYPDLGEAMEAVALAREEFERFPSDIRKRFGNDPRALVGWLSDKNNDQEAVRLGLKVPIIKEDPEDKPLTAKQMRAIEKERVAEQKK